MTNNGLLLIIWWGKRLVQSTKWGKNIIKKFGNTLACEMLHVHIWVKKKKRKRKLQKLLSIYKMCSFVGDEQKRTHFNII